MDESPTDGFRQHPGWLLAVAGLVLAQAGLALVLFGPRPATALADDRPVVSGRHPLHLYHGVLGSQTFYRTGATACFDPSFQAGYPKTPVFDGGSRPAELFLALAGGGYRPAAYKIGLFVCLLLVPAAVVIAARGAGLPAAAACLAGACGVVLSWSAPVRRLIDAGDLDLFAAGLAAVVFVAWLARYAESFGVDSWVMLAGVAAAGWYAHPLVWMGLLPIVVLYYLVYAPRRGLAWHLGLLGVTAAGLAPNLWWLWDWGRYWWLRNPAAGADLPHAAWAELLGGPNDYLPLVSGLPGGPTAVLVGLVGLFGLARAGHRAAAWLLAVGVAVAATAARVSTVWLHEADAGAGRAAPLIAAALLLPAAYALWALARRVRLGGVLAAAAVGGLLVVGWADGPGRPLARTLGLNIGPLALGLTADQQAMVGALTEHTTSDARILWDEPADHRPGWNWSALLPQLTGRAFLGGLDPDAGVEHWFCGQTNGLLNGKPLNQWSDADLSRFCRLYNVGWVVCRSPAATERWSRFAMAKSVARLKDGDRDVVLFTLDRPRSFVLSGSGRWEEATPRHVCLSEVVPDAHGRVVLSLHYQQEMRVYPSYVVLEPMKDADDPIPHVQLHAPGPVPRVTLMWEP